MQTTKTQFEVIDYNAEVIKSISPNAEIFCDAWVNYLESNGWTEDQYEEEFERRAYGTSN